mmetsp:Transcript_30645/g.67325  ORF Transcript_30645/g.67325 Transcript_30645/m.67325 type:complete len:233 (-) Transcript_30645:39-737(-)|eukprot:CAMPEP_0178493634 /NCGR_PEP_ID=MMETSP0696-20121128/12580_1 /TAXON_ID=265572 /ORGANISM="Extubocellulus spinifer, Strain CCMP396" /LENGTH=232 /DNA_ID=CAMNT_0020121647 /DNA_START=77 /DNA_END=775 /DNA_ORIENTATION=-
MTVSPPLSFLVAIAASAAVVSAASGSYWVVYMGDAPESCAAAEAGEAVDPSCCTDFGPQFGLITDSFQNNCFVIPGLLGEGGGSLMSYLGCDDGTPKYGEGCYNNGENGGIIPDGVVVNDTDVASIEECGCTFEVSGNGCHSIRDFNSLPGFEDDTRQVFLYMDETCAEEEGGDDMDAPDVPPDAEEGEGEGEDEEGEGDDTSNAEYMHSLYATKPVMLAATAATVLVAAVM